MTFNQQKTKPGQPVPGRPLSRRFILSAAAAGVGCCIAPGSAQAAVSGAGPEQKSFVFDVLKDGIQVGRHHLNLTRHDTKLLVDVKVRVKVRLGFITAFEYIHDDHEVWDGQRLMSLDARTRKNGESHFVTARPGAGGLEVTSSSGVYTAPGDIMSSSYWRYETVRQNSLLNTQTGNLTDIRVEDQGPEKLRFHGYEIPAQRYRLKGQKLHCDIWYGTRNGQWLGLAFNTHGADITYRPREETVLSAL